MMRRIVKGLSRSSTAADRSAGAILAVAILVAGCATGPTGKGSAKSQSPSGVKLVSTRLKAGATAESCPHNDRSWRKEGLKKLLHYAESCVRDGKFERVEQLGDHLAQAHHATPWGPFFLALAAEHRKEFPRSLWMIELAIKRSPREALLHYQKGRLHWAMGEFKQAVQSYEQTIKENPKMTDAHLLLAQLHFRDHNFKEAARHFAVVTHHEPDNVAAVAGLAEAHASNGNAAAAVELFEKAVNLSPRSLNYRFRLAALYENPQKDYAQALSVYRKIKTMITELRAPAEEIPLDVNDKIQRLESVVNADKSANKEKKVTRSDESSAKKVRK